MMIYQVCFFIYLSFKKDFDYSSSYSLIGAPPIEKDFYMDISNSDENDDQNLIATSLANSINVSHFLTPFQNQL